MTIPIKGLPDVVRLAARASFIGNECGSDEYRETQPEKGLGYYVETLRLLENDLAALPKADDKDEPTLARQALTKRAAELERAMVVWIQTAPNAGAYDGCTEMEPLMGLVFDIFWERGLHPYYAEDAADLIDFLRDTHCDDTEEDRAILDALAPYPVREQ